MRRRHRRLPANTELDITAFMNLMIVLVPVLLLGMVFSQIRTIDLHFPGDTAGEPLDADSLQLVVTLLPGGLEVRDSERGLIRHLPVTVEGQDYAGLRETLRAIKARLPDKTDVVLEVAADMDYQTLIHTMDTVRSYPAVVAASVVDAELFPDVALANAPTQPSLASAPVGGHQR